MDRREALVFNYEEETIQTMLEFATNLRDRRMQYCEDRQRLLQEQRAALSSLSSTPPPRVSRPQLNNQQRYLPNGAPPSTPNQPIPRDFDPNAQINTVDRRRLNDYADNRTPGLQIQRDEQNSIPDNNPQRANSQTMPAPDIRLLPPTPDKSAGSSRNQTYSVSGPLLMVPSNNDVRNSSGGSGSARVTDVRGQSTPTKPEGDGIVQFPPPSDGGMTISNINSAGTGSAGSSRQQSESTAYPRDTTGTGSSRPGGIGTSGSGGTESTGTSRTVTAGGTATYGPGSTGLMPSSTLCRHTCTMAECPICHGVLRIILAPLCEGISPNGGNSAPVTVTSNPTSYGSGSSRPTTNSGGTIAEVQYNTEVSINPANGTLSIDGRTVTGPTIQSSYGTGGTNSSGSRPTATSTGGSNPSTLYGFQYYTDVSSSSPQSGGYSSRYEMSSNSARYCRDTTGQESCPSPNSNCNVSKLVAPIQMYPALFTGNVGRTGVQPFQSSFYRPDFPYGKKNKCPFFGKNKRKEKEEPFEIPAPPPPCLRRLLGRVEVKDCSSDSESAPGDIY